MALGNNVRIYRKAHGETLAALAGAVGMDPSQLSKIERGIGGCSDEFKLLLARHFGVPVTRLFFQDDVEFISTEAR